MAHMDHGGFPRDDYTPHGLLANPHAVAHSWKEGSGGVLRTVRSWTPVSEPIGVGWLYPWALGAQAGIELLIDISRGDHFQSFGWEFERTTLRSPHHSSQLIELEWTSFGHQWNAAFVLVGESEVGLELVGARQASEESNEPVVIAVSLEGWRNAADSGHHVGHALGSDVEGDKRTPPPERYVGVVDLSVPYGAHHLFVDIPTDSFMAPVEHPSLHRSIGGMSGSGRQSVDLLVPIIASRDPSIVLRAILVRRPSGSDHLPGPISVNERVQTAIERARAEDDALWRGGARLAGDWPDAWRRGWVYDMETTRMCVMPAGGVFADVWPSWMVQWPRAVVAEGTLDMVRLAYLSPDLAKRAVLSLFRDAPAPNVPCIFQHGEPNMVAKDGSVCGTSPAWCVPFYNLERLYLLTLDDDWLADLYPYLARYVEWWLAERTDRDGWGVYKCTWEAGEDDTPRLDPERRGDNVVSEFVRPVELQATMALSAAVLARFVDVLGRADEADRWRSVADAYSEKTRTLWDPAAGRFRDWDARAGQFLEPAGEANYWGIDPCRFSALAFTPVLAGLADDAQVAALAREVELYDCPPWTLWASWSYVILETALAAGWRDFAARVAAQIVGRVYPELDRRTVEGNEPTPGVAREYWPLDLSEWRSCEGYGWGATTASFLARQVFGFLEGGYPAPDIQAPLLTFRLAPGLPTHLLTVGRRYALANIPYRGTHASVEYLVQRMEPDNPDPDGVVLGALVASTSPTTCRISSVDGEPVHVDQESDGSHRFEIRNGGLYVVELRPN